ncbi:hypothetical protein HZC09_04055 [Candidatus Micrarchaeota archaeon]|nr:hypothetical protein [Candidatus Micrarchaeota archaeon]
MGVTIHYALGMSNTETVKAVLKRAKQDAEARKWPFLEYSEDGLSLIVHPHPECESLAFEFKTWRQIKEEASREGWHYEHESLPHDFAG